jgi:long-chain acyl-CoA synthetase
LTAQAERPWLRHYPEGVRRSLEYPAIPVHALLDQAAERFPNAAATIFFGGKLTWSELRRQADSFAAALRALGVRKGDRVAIMLPNLPQTVIAYYGALRAGAIVAFFNPLYVEREIEHQLKDCGAKVMVLLDLLYPKVSRVRERTALQTLVCTSIRDYLPFPLSLLYPIKARKEGMVAQVPRAPDIFWFKELLRRHPPLAEPVFADPARDIALLQYTGGTTGLSKGAMLTHRNLVANVWQIKEWMPGLQEGGERILCVMPFFHVYGLTVCMNLGTAIGASLVLVPKFELEKVLGVIDKQKPTLFPGAPPIYVAINNHPRIDRYDLGSIKACISGAAALPVEVQTAFERLTGGRLVEGYGLTEASPVTHCNPVYGRRESGSIGLPLPDTEMKVVDLETGTQELQPGEPGELCIRGPQVMAGYWNRPEETEAALRDGWLHTGDVAALDQDGYTRIVDRKKDLIIAGGYNVYPREVEEVLYEHPAVQEAAVAGIPDEYRGQSVKAYVVLRDGQEATAEQITDWCRQRLARYKVPSAVEFRPSLPKTMIGKVLRRVLLEEEMAKHRAV